MVARPSLADGRRGGSRLGCLVQIIIVGALIYFGIYAGQDMLEFYRFRDAMKQQARFASGRTDQQIKDRLKAFADSVGLPDGASDVSVVRENNRIRIFSQYDQPLRLPFDYQYSVHLRPSAERSF